LLAVFFINICGFIKEYKVWYSLKALNLFPVSILNYYLVILDHPQSLFVDLKSVLIKLVLFKIS